MAASIWSQVAGHSGAVQTLRRPTRKRSIYDEAKRTAWEAAPDFAITIEARSKKALSDLAKRSN